MIKQRYIISVADPEFVGPLAPQHLRDGSRYLQSLKIGNSQDVNPWMRSESPDSRLDEIHGTYTNNPKDAELFDSKNASSISDLLRLLLDDQRNNAHFVEESHAFDGSLVD